MGSKRTPLIVAKTRVNRKRGNILWGSTETGVANGFTTSAQEHLKGFWVRRSACLRVSRCFIKPWVGQIVCAFNLQACLRCCLVSCVSLDQLCAVGMVNLFGLAQSLVLLSCPLLSQVYNCWANCPGHTPQQPPSKKRMRALPQCWICGLLFASHAQSVGHCNFWVFGPMDKLFWRYVTVCDNNEQSSVDGCIRCMLKSFSS